MTARFALSLAWMAAWFCCLPTSSFAGKPLPHEQTSTVKSEPTSSEPAKSDAAKSDAATYDLKYKFSPGETIRSQVIHQATVETTISGTTQHTETISKSVKAWKVTGVDKDGAMTFEHKVENIEMRTAMSGRSEVRFNSQTDAKPPAGYEDAARSVGKILATITIGPHGNVLKRTDPPAAVAAAGATTQIVVPLPETPVAIGHVWNVPHDVDLQIDRNISKKIKIRERYELESVKHGVATIDVETQILTPIDDPKVKVQLIQKTSRGKIKFDIEAGRLIGQQLDLDERVLAFSGADSSMHYLTRYTEELLGPESKPAKTTASKPATKPIVTAAPVAQPDVSQADPTDVRPKSVMIKNTEQTTIPQATTSVPAKLPALVDLKSAIKRANDPTATSEPRTASRPKTDKAAVEK